MSLADRVRATITGALERLADEGAFGPPAEARAHLAAATGWTVERPKRAEHGDLATNVAMALTKKLGKPPRAIAEALVKGLAHDDVVRWLDTCGCRPACVRRVGTSGSAWRCCSSRPVGARPAGRCWSLSSRWPSTVGVFVA